jgi:raffinose/stachyose/melibiose transport system permease protein
VTSRAVTIGFRDTGRYILLSLFALAVLIPFASIITSAFNPPFSLIKGLQAPDPFTFESFINVWTTASFGRLLLTSLTVAAGVVPLAAVVSILAGFAIAHLQVFGGKFLLGLFVFGLVLPTELTIIPLYFNMRSVGLTDTMLGVVLAETAAFVPFGVYWMQASFAGFPRELIEAARVDGASNFTILVRVLLPLSRPSIVTMCVLFFMWSWNQFLLILILISSPENRTAPAALGFFVLAHTRDVAGLCAATILVILPILIVYLIFQRSFISGMLQGAVKA